MEVFNEDRLMQSLGRLASWKRVAFMLLCCERMLPNYERFSAETGFGDVSVLRDAINTAWSWLASERSPAELAALRDLCEQQAPNTEDFRSPYTSAALDAANAVAAILDAVEQPDEARPVEVASLARDTVDLFVQESMNLDPNKPGFEEAILSSSLMQTELSRQRNDLAQLEGWSGPRAQAARDLRATVRRPQLGSLMAAAK